MLMKCLVVSTYNDSHRKTMTYFRFPITFAYECQGPTFTWVIVDLKRPSDRSPAPSPYVQLSHTRARLSILRPFEPAELRTDLSKHILAKLEWQVRRLKKQGPCTYNRKRTYVICRYVSV